MASDLPKHKQGASATIRARLSEIGTDDQRSWGGFPPFLINAPHSKKADKVGLAEGERISVNSELAESLKPLKASLEELTGLTIGTTYFQNWGDTQESLLLYAKPQTVAEVQSLVTAAADQEVNIKVGMGGAYHSWSPTFPDAGGLLINVCDLKLDRSAGTTDGNFRIDLNRDDMTVTISPGVTTGELMQFFLKEGVCFESDVILPTVTYGGVLCGGCHGTGKDQTSMSDWITSMKIVDGTGTLRTISDQGASPAPNDVTVTNEEILRAAQVNLGVFGVVVEFTLEVKEMSKRRVKNTFDKKLGDVFPTDSSTANLSELVQDNWSVELFWFPFNSLFTWLNECMPTPSALQINTPPYPVPEEADATTGQRRNLLVDLWEPLQDELWIREITKTEDEITKDPGVPLWSKLVDVIGGAMGSEVLAPLYAAFPGLFPLGSKTGFQIVKLQYGAQANEVVYTPWAVHFRDAIDLMQVYDLEFCFPINLDDPRKAVDAVQAVIDITKRYAKEGEYPSESGDGQKIHFPLTMCMEMRVLKKGTSLLCPASIGDTTHMAYIEVLSTSGTQGYEQYFAEVAKEWIALGGIPHWQKQWTFLKDFDIGQGDQDIFDYIRSKFDGNLTTFNNVRSQLEFDCDDRFLNTTMKKVLDGTQTGSA